MNNYPNNRSKTDRQKKEQLSLQELMKMPNNRFISEDTYVDDAMKCFDDMDSSITPSKLRSLYSMLCDIVTGESNNNSDRISCLSDLKRLRVHIIYDMGRDGKVKEFMKKTYLVAYLAYVKKTCRRSDFELFCKYFEALVAFHRYLHPKED